MSMKTLPLLFINLGGEMVYILDQRLRAQNIPDSKAAKVLHDIVSTMFSKRFMEELFKPQTLYSKKAMRTVFDRLAHASIMRLNAASMDKLYDLMTMAIKYQISICYRPKDIILSTLNHMDAIRNYVEEAPSIKQQVDYIYRMLIETYIPMSAGECHLMRQTLLNFFQDMHIRVSIFLKDKVQNNNGRFILPIGGPLPYGTEVPGTIRLFTDDGRTKNDQFPAGGSYILSKKEGSFDMKGDRVTKFGTNMYSTSRPVETTVIQPKNTIPSSDLDTSNPNPLAKAHLDLLSQLIGTKLMKDKSEFRLNLFKTDEEESKAAAIRPIETTESQVVKIDASKKAKNPELSRIMGELSVDNDDRSNDDGDDLLDLMDS
ncbi:hypothetical protein LOTGIDRAFT_224648 [Lottia gigantea]|uniref:Protein OSCP1 n=1 Tax=Lottia gigantea TaxID=225164 RepID=V4BAX9_LOTGI|nr:hypothetical protein LOTGIDRAFT_224648 [Lottia gigantea]ESP03137.1 hypothetical protein LOTGIDRAFT_224648 [Lottia gigantea]